VADDQVIDLRTSRFELTRDERALLQTIVDRNVIDLEAIGRSLGTGDDGVFTLMSHIAEKFNEFRYLAQNLTPPLGTGVPASNAQRPRRYRPLTGDAER
jgi:hypothetical protein